MSADHTHDLDLACWVESADSHDDFPIQNLPLGIFTAAGRDMAPGVAIGDAVLDLCAAGGLGLLDADTSALMGSCAAAQSCNPLLAAGRLQITRLRHAVSRMLRVDTREGASAVAHRDALLVPVAHVTLHLPARVGDYTDFYASVQHATNVGRMLRPDNALLPNYKWIPVGYHGRASSLIASGTPVQRPSGQFLESGATTPTVGPTRRLDYEVEVGAFIAAGNARGTPIPIADAARHVAGLCLVNDWSARDVQAWEAQPLGPFLAKNFATTVSPWIVTLDALAPFRTAPASRPDTDPAPLAYLRDADDQRDGAFAITLEVLLSSARMRASGTPAMRVSRGTFASMYWTVAQLVTHHTSNGCNLLPGDLLGSGTVSGETDDSRGCLLERTWGGTRPLTLPSGERRAFLEDGDEVVMRGWCERPGYRRIGFGDCRGIVTAS